MLGNGPCGGRKEEKLCVYQTAVTRAPCSQRGHGTFPPLLRALSPSRTVEAGTMAVESNCCSVAVLCWLKSADGDGSVSPFLPYLIPGASHHPDRPERCYCKQPDPGGRSGAINQDAVCCSEEINQERLRRKTCLAKH